MQGLRRFKHTFIGDRAFYKAVFAIIVPVVIQSGFTNVVSLVDNLMVSGIGTEAMSGVAIANQLLFVFNLCIFGGLAGPSIFGAQFFGAEDMEGLRNTFRIKLWIALTLLFIACMAFIGRGDSLILRYLTGEGEAGSAQKMMASARTYLLYMLPGLVPYALTQCYAGTLRETGETVLPMQAGIASVLTDLFLNWAMIYGHLGFPAMGVMGAAVSTVISRFLELGIILFFVYRKKKYTFLWGVYRTLRVPLALFKSVMRKGLPLLINECLWSMGMAMLTQIYSVRGLLVLAGLNIAGSLFNLFNVVLLAMGNAAAVLIGQALGANEMEKARGDVWKLMFFSASSCLLIGGILAAASPFLPRIYRGLEEPVYALATCFILTSACYMPMNAITHLSYFTLRAGGSTIITFLFDSAYTWAIAIPFAMLWVHMTPWDITVIYPICQAADILKFFIGLALIKKGVWVRNIVSEPVPVSRAGAD